VAESSSIVLVHGAVERKGGFDLILPYLAGLEVISYDRRGHGLRWREGPASLEGDIDDLLSMIGELPATVIGHSLGGLVVLGAALRRPDLFSSIGLYETAIPWGDWWADSDRTAMIEEIDSNWAAARKSDARERPRLEVAWESCRNEVLEAFSAPYRWQDVTVPLKTGRGGTSKSHSARDAGIVANFFGTDMVVLAGAGHRAHRTAPAAFADFVRRCRQPGTG
jgi:pimeloyl-ACP methyl ester carboxylesterase